MVFKLFPNLKNLNKGITLIEIIVAIFIIALFYIILVADFPKILKQFALSRATYKLGQDMRKTEDLGLSGVTITDKNGDSILAQGYGIYADLAQSTTKYVIYADVDNNKKYNTDQSYNCDGDQPYYCCNKVDQTTEEPLTSDCVIEIIDVSKENSSLYIKNLFGTNSGVPVDINDGVSLNFMPPNPTVDIKGDNGIFYSDISIVLGLISDSSAGRMVFANTAGLIDVK